MAKPRGRLELTWTNKHLALLAGDDGGYEWVDPTDHRVKEVRLLRDAGTVGEVHPDDRRVHDNLLIRGDALHALESLALLPQFADELVGKVKLIYIDPPFNTGQAFTNYDDNLEHSVWLTMIRDRLLQAKRLLCPEGSVWLHLDDKEAHRARCVLDEVFGQDNFVANVVWQKSHTRENRTDISTAHDNIIVYAVDRPTWKKVRNLLPPEEEREARYQNPDNDPRGPWASLPLHAKAEKGRRQEQFYEITVPSGRKVSPPRGTCWRFTRGRFEEMVEDGRVWFGEDGDNAPRLKKFLSEVQDGLVPVTIWPHPEVGTTGTAKGEIVDLFPDLAPFSTPKPERLMQRIIHIASDPGDIVLDFFAGSGTTAAVAHKMGRRWIAVERERDTVDTYCAPRLKKVVDGDDPGGITEDVGWEGGGGFRVLDVAESMYEQDDGITVLAEWATNGKLAEATAAQLGFEYEADPPFSGRQGRLRLAVLDGHADELLVSELVSALEPDEMLSLCATSLDPGTASALAKLRPGSQARVIPEDVLLSYRTQSAWCVSVARAEPAADESANGDSAGEAEDEKQRNGAKAAKRSQRKPRRQKGKAKR